MGRRAARYFPAGFAGHNPGALAAHLEANGADDEVVAEVRDHAADAAAALARRAAAERAYQLAFDAYTVHDTGTLAELEAATIEMTDARRECAEFGFASAGTSPQANPPDEVEPSFAPLIEVDHD